MSRPISALTAHLEKLPYFVEVAVAGSFRKASETLRIAQPSLSKAIGVLEAACGVRLFDRRRDGTTLTPEGKRLLETTRTILREIARYEAQAGDLSEASKLGFVTHELLVPVLASTLADLPGPKLGLEISTSPSAKALLTAIQDYKADAGVIAAATAVPGLLIKPLLVDRHVLVCSPGFRRQHLTAHRQPLTEADLADLPFIIAPNVLAGDGETLGERLRRHRIEVPPRHVVSSIESVAALAAAGFGVGVLPLRIGHILLGTRLVEVPARLGGGEPLGRIELAFCCRQESWRSDARVKGLYDALRPAFA